MLHRYYGPLLALCCCLPAVSFFYRAADPAPPTVAIQVLDYATPPAPLAASWWPLGTGLTGGAQAIAVDAAGKVYIGGGFSEAGGVAANNIAVWDGNAWSALGSGLDAECRVLHFGTDGDLYAGGDFELAGGSAANHIARWDGNGWSTLGAGLNATCNAIGSDAEGNVFAGGSFFQAGGENISRIARYGDEAVGVREAAFAEFRVYPNPTAGSLMLTGVPIADGTILRIRDSRGRLVGQRLVRAARVDVADLPPGIYYLYYPIGHSFAVAKVAVSNGK
jgi:hypothetical protein